MFCINCLYSLVIDESNGYYVCTDCGYISNEQIMKSNISYDVFVPQAFCPTNVKYLSSSSSNNITLKSELEERFPHVPKHMICDILDLISEFKSKKVCRGKVMRGIIASVVFYVCKNANQSLTLTEIGETLKIHLKDIHKAKKIFDNTLCNYKCITTLQPSFFVKRFCKNIDVPRKSKYKIISKCNKIISHELAIFSNRQATSICATVIIFVCCKLKLFIDKVQFCEEVNVSVVTVNKLLKLINKLNIQFT